MTITKARRHGYDVIQGAYQGTTDDRLGRWYLVRTGKPVRKWGAGYPSRRAALDDLDRILQQQDLHEPA